MSNGFAETAKALSDDPALAAKVMAAGTPAERAEILRSNGLAVPTHADVNGHHASLNDVSGAGQTTSQIAAGAPVVIAASAVAAG